MRRALAGLVLALLLAACSNGARVAGPRDLPRTANPSAVVAAELAFARAAQDKGQWTAFADFAADDAVMFVPEPVDAKQWLKGRANPAQSVAWQPHQVWSSCDGTLAVTRGAWQRPDGSVGYFTTVWRRQEKNGDYKWVMDQGDTVDTPLVAPEFVIAQVANCTTQPTPPATLLAGPRESLNSGGSRDGTLRWHVVTRPDRSRSVSAEYWDGSAWQSAVSEQVAAE